MTRAHAAPRRQAKQTSASSPWQPGGRHPTSPTPNVPPSRSTLAVTRLADRADPVPDEVFDEAARHYDEQGLAALILMIATTNLFNRLNATTRQVAGSQSW